MTRLRSGKVVKPIYETTLRSARAPPQYDVVRARGRDPTPKPLGKQRSDPVLKVNVNTENISKTKSKTKSKLNQNPNQEKLLL